MKKKVTIRDETVSGTTLREWMLDLLTERVTVRELIRSRVYQEVEDFNRSGDDVFHGLVQPSDTEAALNGYRLRRPRRIEWQPQFEKAAEAFAAGRVLVLAGDRQAESLDEEIEIGPDTVVSFLRLVPLVGG